MTTALAATGHGRPARPPCARQRDAVAVVPLMATLLLSLLVPLLLPVTPAAAVTTGQLLWAQRIGSATAEAGADALAAGPDGVTAIAGWKTVGDQDVPMVARFTAGGRKWVRTLPWPGDAYGVAVDRKGNVYAAAKVSPGAGSDIVVAKWGPTGTLRWVTTPYDEGPGTLDWPVALTLDRSGNVIVLGVIDVPGTWGAVVLKYRPDGTPAWPAVRYDPSADPDAGAIWPYDVVTDGAGDIYFAGSAEYLGTEAGFVAKVAGADGSKVRGWLDEPVHAPCSRFLALALRGSSLVAAGMTGYPGGGGHGDAVVARYSLGLEQRSRVEWGTGNDADELLWDVVIDSRGAICATGGRYRASDGTGRAVTVKFPPTLTGALWKATYLPASHSAEGWYITRDGADNVYVAGIAVDSHDRDRMLVIKYGPGGARKWLRTWAGGGPDDSDPCGIALGTKGGVHVAGEVSARGDVWQAALLKYAR